jgi:hypothetical protein
MKELAFVSVRDQGPARGAAVPGVLRGTEKRRASSERLRDFLGRGQMLLRLFDFRACLLDAAFDELGFHFGFLPS